MELYAIISWEKNIVGQQLSTSIEPYKAVHYNKKTLAPKNRRQSRGVLNKNGVLMAGFQRRLAPSERRF